MTFLPVGAVAMPLALVAALGTCLLLGSGHDRYSMIVLAGQ